MAWNGDTPMLQLAAFNRPFAIDSQSALALLSTALAFLQPKCFWDILALRIRFLSRSSN